MLAYTGIRFGELSNLLIQDVRAGLPLGVLDVSSDADRSVKTRTSVRTIPAPPALVEILDAHCRAQPRLTGRLFEQENGLPIRDIRRMLSAVARRAGMALNAIRPKRFRTTYATWRPTVDGVTLLDVQQELGHASLTMLAKVYGRTRHTKISMGAHLDYNGARWLSAEDWSGLESIRPTAKVAERMRERAEVVRAFLASVDGLSVNRAETVSGVERNAIRRLRAGQAAPENIKGRTLAGMREHLARMNEIRIPPFVALAA